MDLPSKTTVTGGTAAFTISSSSDDDNSRYFLGVATLVLWLFSNVLLFKAWCGGVLMWHSMSDEKWCGETETWVVDPIQSRQSCLSAWEGRGRGRWWEDVEKRKRENWSREAFSKQQQWNLETDLSSISSFIYKQLVDWLHMGICNQTSHHFLIFLNYFFSSSEYAQMYTKGNDYVYQIWISGWLKHDWSSIVKDPINLI